jgi:glycosyltransferase involved in cell wall biosynthesis
VLVLSRNYPNSAIPLLGLWVQETVRAASALCEQIVVSPVPYCPPLPGIPEDFSRFRNVDRRRLDGVVEVLQPRFLVGPGSRFAATEALSYYASVAPLVRRLRRRFPFDLVHAHFTYPDGFVAALLARRYEVPVIITEQAPWGPWLEAQPLVRRQALWAARNAAHHIAISSAVRDSIVARTASADNVRVIPDGVDGDVFRLPPPGVLRARGRILFVGAIRPVKGVDVLLNAMRILVDAGRDVRLVLVGEGHFRSYRREQKRLEREAEADASLEGRVDFVGAKPLDELVRLLQTSDVLVLPSRAESLGMVLVEALACGTPVVATRCGGPEDIVTDRVGELVAPEDPSALAMAIGRVLDREGWYDPAELRAHALRQFGIDGVIERIVDLYDSAVGRTETAATPPIAVSGTS